MSPTVVSLNEIEADRSTWPRLHGDDERVAQFIDLYGEGDLGVLPPLVVAPLDDGTYLLVDGWHRLAALEQLGFEEVHAEVVRDTGGLDPYEYAYQYGLESCAKAAKPLSRTEKRRAVERLIADRPDLNDSAIARVVGVSRQTVGRVRVSNGQLAPPKAERGDRYLAALSSEEQAALLVRGLAKIWESRSAAMAMGLANTNRLGDDLARALLDAYEAEEAVTWAERFHTWAERALAQIQAAHKAAS